MTLVYCIGHEEIVKLEQGSFCTGHTFVLYNDPEIGLSSLDFCCLDSGFAYSPPPPALFSEDIDGGDYNWEYWCEENEPSSNEVFISNLHAYELKADFEGAL